MILDDYLLHSKWIQRVLYNLYRILSKGCTVLNVGDSTANGKLCYRPVYLNLKN